VTETGVISIFVTWIVFGFTAIIVATVLITRHRDRALRHETIRVALEKGQQVPPELLTDPQGSRTRRSDLSYGVLLVFTGVGLSAFLWSIQNRNWAAGLICIALGVGYLVSHVVASRGSTRQTEPR
jgi:Domain of unknown function (DUF6249)